MELFPGRQVAFVLNANQSLARAILHNGCMASTYLTVEYKDKDAAKALGARWDAAQRQWFVPEGRDLAPFAAWICATSNQLSTSTELSSNQAVLTELSVAVKKGVSLSLPACRCFPGCGAGIPGWGVDLGGSG